MALPEWITPWCLEHLGAEPVDVLHRARHLSEVIGLRLADGREVAVKSRPDQDGRETTCVEVQRVLAGRGFPCAAPLTGVTTRRDATAPALAGPGPALAGPGPALAGPGPALAGPGPAGPVPAGRVRVGPTLAVHAEEWRAGGSMLLGDDPPTAKLFGALLGELVTLSADVPIARPPLPNPEWVRWDHLGPGTWPSIPDHADLAGRELPEVIETTGRRVRERLATVQLPSVLGHADWESQNLRWHGTRPYAVHDWDSLAWQPEAAIAGLACGAFASAAQPTLAPIASSAAFLDAYQGASREFTPDEIEVAWATSLWPALHNARNETLWNMPPVALTALHHQAADRLHRAAA